MTRAKSVQTSHGYRPISCTPTLVALTYIERSHSCHRIDDELRSLRVILVEIPEMHIQCTAARAEWVADVTVRLDDGAVGTACSGVGTWVQLAL